MATKLRKLKIDRVDLVDEGANQHAHVMLFKRNTPPEEDTMTQEALDSITKRLSDIEKANSTLQTEIAKRDTQIADLTKSLTDAETARKASDTQLQALRDEAATKEAAELAKSLGLTADKAGMLKVAKTSLPAAEYDALVETFKANKAAVDQALSVTKGATSVDAPVAGSADAEITKRATELIAKGAATTREDAIAAVVTADPELYNRQQAELADARRAVR